MFERVRAEESVARAGSQKARSMAVYNNGTSSDPEEEEEEKNSEGDSKQPETNPIGGNHGWEKESAARACSERVGNLAGIQWNYLTSQKRRKKKHTQRGIEKSRQGNFSGERKTEKSK